MLRITQTLPLPASSAPQPLTLLYPKELPGTHGPYGRVEKIADLAITAVGAAGAPGPALPWRRDTLDTHAFHLTVPAGASALTLRFAYLAPQTADDDRISMTEALLGVQWENTVLYPAGLYASALRVQPTLRLPSGWQAATALRAANGALAQGDAQGRWVFGEINLETLIDSPVFASPHTRRVELDAPGTAQPIALHLLADSAATLATIPEPMLAAHRRLAQQGVALFGQRPWRHYDFLLALSDHFGGMGLEHHESSENVLRPDYFSDWDKAIRGRELLAHEFTHAWNGKAMRPAALWTPNYNVPMDSELLWVYEGLTEYWGHVLAVRAGLTTPEQARDGLAQRAGYAATQSGRLWRSIADTTQHPRFGAGTHYPWPDLQRDRDYYDQGLLVWLEADALIRERSKGQRSLDDFARRFFGTPPARRADGSAIPQRYTFADLVAALATVQPMDWATWLRQRLDATGQGAAPLGGLQAAGWQLAWQPSPGPFQPNERGWGGANGTERPADFYHALGIQVLASGAVDALRWGSPAFAAGMPHGATLLAVDGLTYTPERLGAALLAAQQTKRPIPLLIKHGERYQTVAVPYFDGPRFPALVRASGADWLAVIYSAR